MSIENVCSNCSSTFESISNGRKYCSRKCYFANTKGKRRMTIDDYLDKKAVKIPIAGCGWEQSCLMGTEA